MKWISILVLSLFAVVANATPEAEALQIVTPQQDDFHVNPDARVTLRYRIMPAEFTAPVVVKIILDGEHVDTMITNIPEHEYEFSVLQPGSHTVELEATGEDQYSRTEPVRFTVRKPSIGTNGSIVQ